MKISLIPISKKRSKSDLFAAGLFEKERIPKDWLSLEPEFAQTAKAAIEQKRFEGKQGQSFYSYQPGHGEASEILLVGLGPKKNYSPVVLRKAVGEIVKQAEAHRAKNVRLFLDSFIGGKTRAIQAVGILQQMALLASYDFGKYKTKKQEGEEISGKLERIEVLFVKKLRQIEAEKAAEKSCRIAEGVISARDLVNEPGNVMNALKLSEIARELARKKKLSCKILGQTELEKLKMEGILAVNRGSTVPPALIILEYGKQYKKKGTVCLVGKGVTFDTGGISLKPSKGMEAMKYDMSGAAAVIAVMGVLGDLRPALHVVGLVPAVENTVAQNPQRPGDIIKLYGGKTVEVVNTDAEGRLILADALAYTEKFKPKTIIDLATLTGSCMHTFGDQAIGLLGNNPRLLDRVKRAGEETGERCWELPLWDEYGGSIKGHHSDLKNIGGHHAGAITAAMFLKEFVPKNVPWAHLDIAGTAWCDSPRYDCPKGATGVGVRLVSEILSSWR